MVTQPVDVPEHILDMIPAKAIEYVETQQERWLAQKTDEEKQRILANSTHNLVANPKRRALHRSILQRLDGHISGDAPEKPIYLYVTGPMAVGKSTLLTQFNCRLQKETGGISAQFNDAHIERMYEIYREVMQRYIKPDFELYKRNLPEFAESGNDFAIIRAEAHGLNTAVLSWATELKAHRITEELGDAPRGEFAQRLSQEFRLVALGVTANPGQNAERLRKRNQERGEQIGNDELIRTIKRYSAKEVFPELQHHAEFAALVKSEDDGQFRTIRAAKNGTALGTCPPDYEEFLSYTNLPENSNL